MKPIDKRLSAEDKLNDLCNAVNSILNGEDFPYSLTRIVRDETLNLLVDMSRGSNMLEDVVRDVFEGPHNPIMTDAFRRADLINSIYEKIQKYRLYLWAPLIANVALTVGFHFFK